MKKSHILYIIGVFIFGAAVAWGISQGASYSRLSLLTKPFFMRIIAEASPGTTTEAIESASVTENETASSTLPDLTPEYATLPGKHIVADLKDMKLVLYKDGIMESEFPIVSKGRPGTAWETIPGTYTIKTKEENHLSSIGHVWMPYSMQFFGNYFIHGWPYYPGGAEVPKGFSGGCIRLQTADAKRVYEFADISTAVHVIGDEEVAPAKTASYTITKPKTIPRVSAKAYLIADLDTGEVILENDKFTLRPTASLAKLMTAAISLEVINQYQDTTVSASAVATYGDQGGLKEGEVYEIKELLYPLLLESSNDASEVLAEHIGRKRFINLMNEKALAIGLTSTHFDDPAGLSAETVSTPRDLFKLVQYVYKYKSYILDVTKLPQYSAYGHTWNNISRFVNDANYLGGKNGYTDEARHTLISLFKLPLSEFSDRNIAFILLDGDASTKEEDMRALVKFVGSNVFYTPEKTGNTLTIN